MDKKSIGFERKSNEGFVIETPYGSIEIVVSPKLNQANKFNGRTNVKILMPDKEAINVYRIDSKGKPQNRKTKEFIHDGSEKTNKIGSS